MIIRSVKLSNIRSYLNSEIIFPEGSTLLSGDIGSGKSTVLLAIEFALFGVKRKDLSGSALLRHGKKEGSVELKFSIGKKEVMIKRNLKRGKEGINQDTGYIIIDGIKKEGTAVELKTIILDLLGYPKGLVTKSKDLIYRYTVYTPQDEMKQILTEDKDIRLDILRRVFGIDKYKRIKENSVILTRDLKEKRIAYESQLLNLESKQRQKKEKQDELQKIGERLADISPKVKEAGRRLKGEKENLEKIEGMIKELEKLKNELKINEIHLKNRVEEVNRNRLRIDSSNKHIQALKKELETKEEADIETLLKQIKETEEGIKVLESSIRDISRRLAGSLAQKSHSLGIKEKITQLDRCPTCKQDVSQEHKKHIHQGEDELLARLEKEIAIFQVQEKEAEDGLNRLKESLRHLKDKEKTISILNLKLESMKEKKKEAEELEEQEKMLKQDIGAINLAKLELSQRIQSYKDIEEDYKRIRGQLDIAAAEERRLELQQAALEKEKEGITNMIISLEKEISEKLEMKGKLDHLSQMQNWLEEHFMSLMALMEKHMMLRIHYRFNQLFQQWFDTIIEDEIISVRIDDGFDPVIEQNGYETSLDNLSGGEKTSVALAYRLALNKVINDIVSEIKTNDLIMLDEPTDGFSAEQLDKIRVVLEQLDVKQTIIVSHESKIESFVDNVIKINKDEHISEIV